VKSPRESQTRLTEDPLSHNTFFYSFLPLTSFDNHFEGGVRL